MNGIHGIREQSVLTREDRRHEDTETTEDFMGRQENEDF